MNFLAIDDSAVAVVGLAIDEDADVSTREVDKDEVMPDVVFPPIDACLELIGDSNLLLLSIAVVVSWTKV